ncbi:MAG: penicillin acylase family protein, partial [Flavobacteriales bacterium]|nr:penicillin acylase family protein [Flavobacteriales bacterium]
GTLDVTLGQLQVHKRGDVEYPIWGSLETLAAIHTEKLDDGRLRAKAGDCYIELVRFTKEGVQIETVNSYGSSANPDSPHYTDQMELFVNQQYKKMTLDRKEIERNAERRYSPK